MNAEQKVLELAALSDPQLTPPLSRAELDTMRDDTTATLSKKLELKGTITDQEISQLKGKVLVSSRCFVTGVRKVNQSSGVYQCSARDTHVGSADRCVVRNECG